MSKRIDSGCLARVILCIKIIKKMNTKQTIAIFGATGNMGSGISKSLAGGQLLLTNSKIIKAFNTVFAAGFAQQMIAGQQVDAFIAGSDQDALEIAALPGGLVSSQTYAKQIGL